MQPDEQRWTTVAEVAAYLQISRAKIYELAQTGQIPCVKVGGEVSEFAEPPPPSSAAPDRVPIRRRKTKAELREAWAEAFRSRRLRLVWEEVRETQNLSWPLADGPAVTSPADIYRAVRHLADADREVLAVVHLDHKHRLRGAEVVAIGTLDQASVHPREVLKGALLSNSAAFALVHTHPSGDPWPSDHDIIITGRIGVAADVLGLRLLDHLVLGHGERYFSFVEEGLLDRVRNRRVGEGLPVVLRRRRRQT